MTETTEIYVRLVDEAVDVWRPIRAQVLGDGLYLVPTAPSDERWEFAPGTRVRCVLRSLGGSSPVLVADRAVDFGR